MREYTTRVWADIKDQGKCRDCHQPVVWRINDRGKNVLINPCARVVHTQTDEHQRRWDVFSNDDLHFATCRVRREKASGAHA